MKFIPFYGIPFLWKSRPGLKMALGFAVQALYIEVVMLGVLHWWL